MEQYLIEQKKQHEKNQNHNTFTLKQIAEISPQQILEIILEKEKIIHSFSQQITRLKAQQIKSKKLISSLQQKIQKTMSSGTNTSNTFMIISEFKNLLTSFMTNTVPSVFYDFADHPKVYALLLKRILQGAYNRIQQILKEKLRKIVSLLKSGQKDNSGFKINQSHQQQLRLSLLNYFQNNFKEIFQCIFSDQNEAVQQLSTEFKLILIKTSQNGADSQILQKIQNWNQQQSQHSQEMRQFCQQLYQICIYMVLQQSPWQFVFDEKVQQNNQKNLFTKKQFTCIDGFAKQGKQVIFVLKGLRKKQNSDKQFHYHPNIKNFVIPASDEDQTYKGLNLEVEINIFKNQRENFHQVDDKLTKKQDEKCYKNQQVQLDLNDFQSLSKQVSNKNKSIQLKSNHLKDYGSFTIQAVEQTQKSEIISSTDLTNRNQQKLGQRKDQINCVINPVNDQNAENNENDKQNINSINFPNMIPFIKQKHSQSHTKKQKHLVQQKGLSKKSKKQKNNSTVDLTNQKRKLSQKDQPYNHREVLDDISNNMNNLRNYELPLGNVGYGKSSHKKRVTVNNIKNSTSRKCSVGKIVSQSVHMGMNLQTKKQHLNNKQKISLSQHSTLLMKQSISIKNPSVILKDNFVTGHSNQLDNVDYRDKQNIGLSHIYQKPLTRPKRSMKLTVKNQDKMLINNALNTHNLNINHNGSKQERPLIIRQHKNNNNVGRLRQKYLIN